MTFSSTGADNPVVVGSCAFHYSLIDSVMNILSISVTNQAGGFTLSLKPLVRRELQETFPHTDALPAIFVSRTNAQNFEKLRGRLLEHLVPALTGLSADELKKIGQILFVDAASGNILSNYESKATS